MVLPPLLLSCSYKEKALVRATVNASKLLEVVARSSNVKVKGVKSANEGRIERKEKTRNGDLE